MSEKPESVEPDCSTPETCMVCHVCNSTYHSTQDHPPCGCDAEARAQRMEKALRRIAKLKCISGQPWDCPCGGCVARAALADPPEGKG